MRIAIQLVLAVAIVALGYYLYFSITDPGRQYERQLELTDLTRERMQHIRTALISFERENDYYTADLDSLVAYVKGDSLLVAKQDSVFQLEAGQTLMVDSLPISPRTGNRFLLSVNDTSDVDIYLLEDPDSDDRIGAAEPIASMRNAASWE
ncbi:MAG: hypothetical protein AAF809_02435 [Bacteroidota bacterium]